MTDPRLAPLDYILMVSYLLGITFLGIWCTRKKSNTEDFLLGGGKTRWYLAAITFVMAISSTLSLVAVPGESYNHGLRLYVADWIHPISAFIMFSLFVRFYFVTKTFTPFSYLERRFDSRVRCIISILYLFSRLSYLAMVLFSCTVIFKGVAGWPSWVSVLVMSSVCIFYCVTGGFRAVLLTNIVQFMVLWGGLIAAFIAATLAVEGGVFGVIQYSFSHGRGFEFGEDFFSFDPQVRLTFWLVLFSSLSGYMFYSSADQMALQPLLSTSSYRNARKTVICSILMVLPITAILYYLGLAMFAYFGQNPVEGGNPSGDTALFYFVSVKMPAPLPGLVVSGMLAAAISTIASGLAGSASVATKDIYLRFFRPHASEQMQVKFSRIAIFLVGLVTSGIAFMIIFTSKALGETLIESSAIYISIMCIIPTTFFVGIMNPRCNSNHALGGMLFGTVITIVMVIIYMSRKFTDTPISFMVISIPGFIGTILFGLIVPLIYGEKPSPGKVSGLTLWTFKNKQ